MIEDPRGQWTHPGKNTRIPGNQITMEGVDYPVWAVPDVGEPVLMQPGQSYTFPGASYVDEYPMLEQGGELPKAQTGLSKFLKYLKPNLTVPNKIINKSNKFKSEINWSNWNKDIPKNKALMDEYKAIEKTFKGNGTWMKNADGSPFTLPDGSPGLPEQFVQVNSKDFKKAFPEGYSTVYRGATKYNPTLIDKKDKGYTGVFTGNKELARNYNGSLNYTDDFYFDSNTPEDFRFNGLYELAIPKSSNFLKINANRQHWTEIPLKGTDDIISKAEYNIKAYKNMMDRAKKSGLSHKVENYQKKIDQLGKEIQSIIDAKYIAGADLQKLRNNLGEFTSTDDLANYMEKQGLSNIQIDDVLDGIFGDVTIANQVPGNYAKSLRGNNGMFDMTNPNIYKALIPLLGVAGLGLPENKFGGEYETKELTDAEIEEYVKGGYIVEEELPKAKFGIAKLAKYFKPKPIPKPISKLNIKHDVFDKSNPKDIIVPDYYNVYSELGKEKIKILSKFKTLKEGKYDGLFPSTYAKRKKEIDNMKSLIDQSSDLDKNIKITSDNLGDIHDHWMDKYKYDRNKRESFENLAKIKRQMGISNFNLNSPKQIDFIQKYPSYSSWLYKNDKADLIGDFENAFDSKLVDNAIKQQSTFVRGIKDAPNEEVAKQWLTTLGDVEAEDRSLLNLGEAVYGSNAEGLMEAFSRGKDISGNFGGILKLDLGLDGLSPIKKLEGFEKAVRQSSDRVNIPGHTNISIKEASKLGKQEELRKLGIKAIDNSYTDDAAERGVIDDAIIKLDELIDLSNIGTAKPIGRGGMWGVVNGYNIKANEDLFQYVNNIKNLHKAWPSMQAKHEWMARWKKIYTELYDTANNTWKETESIQDKVIKNNTYKELNHERVSDLQIELYRMQKELKGKLQKTILQTGVGIATGITGVGLYNATTSEEAEERRRRSQRKLKLVNNKPPTENTNSPLPKNMLGGELSQDQDSTKGTFVNSKEHGVDTPVYVQVEEKKSPIHGTGVFSKDPISKGQSIGVSHIRKKFEKNGEMYQAPFPSKQIGGYNHSEEPNVTEVDNGDHISLIAIRDIQPGEELLSNYDDSEIQDMERSSDFIRKDVPKAKDGHIVKQRRGVRNNPDGSVSSHLMKAEYVDGRGWVGFPSLFQDSKPYADDQENWNEVSEKDGWWPIYQEAVRRGEVYDFGEDKEAALAFGMGSWKDQLPEHLQNQLTTPEQWGQSIKDLEHQIGNPKGWTMESYNLLQDKLNAYKNWRETTPEGQAVHDNSNKPGEYNIQLPEHLQDNQEGGFQLELTPEEIDKYVKGGYVVEELPKANKGLITLANLAKPLITGAGSSNKIIKGLSRGIIDKGVDILPFLAPETMKKYAIDAARMSAGQGDYNIAEFLEDINKGYSGDYMGQDVDYKNIHGKGAHKNRDLIDLYFNSNESNFSESRWLSELENKNALKKYTDYHGPLKSYALLSEMGNGEYISGHNMLANEIEIANPSVISKPGDRIDHSIGDGIYTRRGHDTYSDFGSWSSNIANDAKKQNNPDKIIKAYNQIFDRFGDVIPFEVNSGYNQVPNFKLNNNPIKHIDDIAGHMAFLRRNSPNSFDLTTRDVWGFHPVDYNKKWLEDTRDKTDPWIQGLGSKLFNKFGKPFILTQTNPFHFDFKKGGELPKANRGWLSKVAKYVKPKPEVVSKIINRSITPIGYDPFTVAAAPLELLTPKALKYKPKTFATKNRFDAWKVYNGLEPDFNTFSRNADGTLAINDFRIDKNTLQSIISNPKSSFGTMEIENQLNFGGVHGNGMITKGKDELGKFIDFTDTWDLQPFKNFKNLPKKARDFEVSSLTSGKPFDLKNRIYYDDSGNFFDHNKNKLIEEIQHFPIGQVKRDKAVDLKMLSTPNVVGVKQMDVIHDWDKATNQKFAKGAGVAGGLIFSGMGYLEYLRQKENEQYSLKNKQNEELIPAVEDTLEEKKLGGELPKAKYGKWMKYLNPPNPITTSKKFLFTPPEELLRTEAAWNMMNNNNYYSLGNGPAKVVGLRDFKKQLTSKHDHAKFVNKVKQFDKAIDRVSFDKRLSESAKEARIDELVKAQMEVEKKLYDIQSEYSKFKLDYSGLPITQARGKHGDQLSGGQGRIFNNLLDDKEYIKYGSFFGDENDMQNLINAGKKFNSSYAEAAFPTEAFRVGEDNLQNGQRFVQFMPKLDYSRGLSVDSDVIYNTVKELNELGVGLDYMGLDNIGSVGDKLGLVDLSYIGKPGERNKVFNINSDVFLPDVTNNKLGSKELVREIREMIAPGSGVTRRKEGGSVELGDVVDKATMERLKAQGYTFEEI